MLRCSDLLNFCSGTTHYGDCMSKTMEEEFKRWTVKRKAQLVLDILQGYAAVAGTSRAFGLALYGIEERVWGT